ncbi:MAG: methyltransferase domain-containing protein [Planctomycetota bacterium]|nr:MAG: methyltransferase domain-containing protein [Planctomycetota bacterium]
MSALASAGYVTDVAYVPGFYPQLAPVAVRFVATLNRVTPPSVADGFRYLELGCGLGRSLTALAAANPRGEFIGVDINPEHTAAIAHNIEAGGLTNARIITSDFANLPDDIRDLQFIALHGVYSWVAPQVRADILRIASERLAPGGLLLVSYNAMPGWAHLQPIRGILRQYAALRQGDSLQRMRDAVTYLAFIRDQHAKYFDDNPRAAAFVDTIRSQDPRYLAHEYLNEHWTSFYFAEVAEQFGGAGLTFAGSLPVHTNFWDLCVAPGFQELFRTTTNRLVTEAHKDFCANTAFRWDIYAKQPRLMPGTADRLRLADDFWFRTTRPDIHLPYSVNLGVVTSTVQGQPYEMLLEKLSGKGRRLSEIVSDPDFKGFAADDLSRAVDAGVAMRLFDISVEPFVDPLPSLGNAISLPCRFNRAMLATDLFSGRGLALASRVTGTALTIGDLEAAILSEMLTSVDDDLPARVDALMASRDRVLQREGKPVTDPAERRQRITEAYEAFRTTILPQLEQQGVVTRGG